MQCDRRFTFRRATRLGVGLVMAGACAALTAGCVVGGDSTVKTHGRYIGDQTISRIIPGKMDKKWVHAVLGEPTSRSVPAENTEIWKWEYSRIKTSSGSVLFAVASGQANRQETQIRNVYVEFEGEIVKQVWRD